MIFRRLLGGTRRQNDTRKRTPFGTRRALGQRLQCLEPRLPLANDFFVVPGSSSESVTVSFEWLSRSARYNNEIGVYAVSDDAGTVAGLRPGDSGYSRAVQQSGDVLFRSGTGAGQQTSLTFTGGQRLGFFIIQNGSLSGWRGNGDNRIGRGTIAFFSFDQANPDKFDHVRSTTLSSTSKQFAFEDLSYGGDRDFNDAVIRVSRTSSTTPSQIPAPTIGLATESDTGTVGDQGTNLASVNLTGTTLPGARAELVGRNQSQTADSQGAFTFTGVSLNQGTNNFTLRITDSAGNTRDQAFSVNRQTSTLSATFNLTDATDSGNRNDLRTTFASVNLTGNTQANVTVELVGRSQQVTSSAAGVFNFSNLPLSLGTNSFTVRVRDTFGNSSERTLVITRDPEISQPNVTLDPASDTGTSGDNITSSETVTLKGTATAGARLQIATTAHSTIADASGNFTLTGVPLTQVGANFFNLIATDNFGNNSQSRSITITRLDVTLQLDRGSDAGTVGDLVTNTDEVTLVGQTAAGALVELVGTGLTVTADPQGRYSFANVDLADGNNVFEVKTTLGGESKTRQFTVVRDNQDPTFAAPAAPVQLYRGMAPADQTKVALDLWSIFVDADMNNSLVRLVTNEGNIDIELYDRDAPRTVANYLNYVESGAYDNTIFHRRDTNFVLQGGNNEFNGTSPNSTLPEIDADPAVLNEYSASRPNVRGTLAMAKQGATPPTNQSINSATNNFFVNLKDNTSILNNTQNGGFTVFGKVTDDTMSTVDALASIPVQNRGGALNQLPLQDFNGNFPGNLTPDNLAYISDAMVLRQVEDLTFSNVTTDNPNVVATVENNRIILSIPASGAVSTQITITATDRAGASVTGTFTVNIT
jgi:cyclophilin family peptidyl-prolyl cis-trans isomerase